MMGLATPAAPSRGSLSAGASHAEADTCLVQHLFASASPEFEERLAVAKKVPCLVFPRGSHETSANFKGRLQVAKKAKRSILPKSESEPDKGFQMRVDMQVWRLLCCCCCLLLLLSADC